MNDNYSSSPQLSASLTLIQQPQQQIETEQSQLRVTVTDELKKIKSVYNGPQTLFEISSES